MPELRPAAAAPGPLTITICPAGCVVTAWPCGLNAGSSTASTAAATTAKCCGPAAGEDGARRDPLERRLAHRRRHRAERAVRVAAGEHRLDPLGRRRDAAGRRSSRARTSPRGRRRARRVGGELSGVVGRLGGAARLAQRRLGSEVDSEELGERGRVPADDGSRDLAAGADRDGGRHGVEAVGARGLVRRRLRRASTPRSPCGARAGPRRPGSASQMTVELGARGGHPAQCQLAGGAVVGDEHDRRVVPAASRPASDTGPARVLGSAKGGAGVSGTITGIPGR